MHIYNNLDRFRTTTAAESEWDKLKKPSDHYMKYHVEWEKARDVSDGSRAVKAKGSMYLPPIGQTQKKELRSANYFIGKDRQYDEYLQTAPFYNQTARTVDVYQGSLFRKNPVVENGTSDIDGLLLDLDLAGNSFEDVTRDLTKSAITTGYVGIYVDHAVSEVEQTKAEAQEANNQPYTVLVTDHDILAVKRKKIGGKMQLGFIKLMTREEILAKDGFNYVTEERVIIMDLMETVDGPVYRNRVWKQLNGDDGKPSGLIELLSTTYPQIRGAFQDAVPFWLVGDGSMSIVRDLVDINLDHYVASANHNRLLRNTAWPVITISEGENKIDPADRTKLRTRMNKGIWGSVQIIPNGATLDIKEFSGKDAEAHMKNLTSLEMRASSLGAYTLQQKDGVESSDTIRVRAAGQMSSLSMIGHAVGETMGKVLSHMSKYFGEEVAIIVTLNTDYLPEDLDPAMLKTLMEGVQMGAIPVDTMFKALKDADRLPEVIANIEDYLEALRNSVDVLGLGEQEDLDFDDQE